MSVSEHTDADGHAVPAATVGHGVTHPRSVVGQPPARPLRPFRCLRHRAWMAACTDCRTAHSIRIAERDEPAPGDGSR